MMVRWFAVLFLVCWAAPASPLPPNIQDYDIYSGLVDIPYESYVEGSHQHGGMQPDYIISKEDPFLMKVIAYAHRVKKMDLDFWKKIQRITMYISRHSLPLKDYDEPAYLKLSKKYKQRGEDIPIGKYLQCGAGVCRENALILHFALKEAGIESFHTYAQVHARTLVEQRDIIEDHAFVVVEKEGQLWILDSYNPGFHGYLLEEVMEKEGVSEHSTLSPVAEPLSGFRRIVRINSFPRILVPKGHPTKSIDPSDYFKAARPRKCSAALRKLIR